MKNNFFLFNINLTTVKENLLNFNPLKKKIYILPIFFSDYLFNKFCIFFLIVSFFCLGSEFLIDHFIFFIKAYYVFDQSLSNFINDWNVFLYKDIFLLELPFKESVDHNINSRNFLHTKDHLLKGAFSLGDLNYVKFLQVIKENTQEFDNEYQKRMKTRKKTMGIYQQRIIRRHWWFPIYEYKKIRLPFESIKMQNYVKYNNYGQTNFIYDHHSPIKSAFLNLKYDLKDLRRLLNPNLKKAYLVNTRDYAFSAKDGYTEAPGVIGHGPNTVRIFGQGSYYNSKYTPDLKNMFKYGKFVKQHSELLRVYRKAVGYTLIDSKLIYKKANFIEKYTEVFNNNSKNVSYFNESLLFGKKFNWFKFSNKIYNASSDELLKNLFLSKKIKYNYRKDSFDTDSTQLFFEADRTYPKEFSELYKKENLHIANSKARVVELNREYVVKKRKKSGFSKNGAVPIRYKPIIFDEFLLKRVPYKTVLKKEYINDLFYEPTAYRKNYWDTFLLPNYGSRAYVTTTRFNRASFSNIIDLFGINLKRENNSPETNGFLLSHQPNAMKVKTKILTDSAQKIEDKKFIQEYVQQERIVSNYQKSKKVALKEAKYYLKKYKKEDKYKEKLTNLEFLEKRYMERWITGYNMYYKNNIDENIFAKKKPIISRTLYDYCTCKFFSYRYDDKYNMTNKSPFISSFIFEKNIKNFYVYRWISIYKPIPEKTYNYITKLANKLLVYMPYRQNYALFLKKNVSGLGRTYIEKSINTYDKFSIDFSLNHQLKLLRYLKTEYMRNPQYGVRDLPYRVGTDGQKINGLNKDFTFMLGKFREYRPFYKLYNNSKTTYSLTLQSYKYYKTIYTFRENLATNGRDAYLCSKYITTKKDPFWPATRKLYRLTNEFINHFSEANVKNRESTYNNLTFDERKNTTWSEEFAYYFGKDKSIKKYYKPRLNIKSRITAALLYYIFLDPIANNSTVNYPMWHEEKRFIGTPYDKHKFLTSSCKSNFKFSELKNYLNKTNIYNATPKIALTNSELFGKGQFNYKLKLESNLLPNGYVTIHPKRPGHVQHILNFIDYKYSSQFDNNILISSITPLWDIRNNRYTEDLIDYIYPKFKLIQYLCNDINNFLQMIDDINTNKYANEIDPKIIANSLIDEKFSGQRDSVLLTKSYEFFFKKKFNTFSDIYNFYTVKNIKYDLNDLYTYNNVIKNKVLLFKKFCQFKQKIERPYNDIYEVKDKTKLYYPSTSLPFENDPLLGEKYYLDSDGKPIRKSKINIQKVHKHMAVNKRTFTNMSPLSATNTAIFKSRYPTSMYYVQFDLAHELKTDMRYYLLKNVFYQNDFLINPVLIYRPNNINKKIDEIYKFLNVIGNQSYLNFDDLSIITQNEINLNKTNLGLNTHYLPISSQSFSFIKAREESVLTIKTLDPRKQLYLYLRSFIVSDIFNGTNINTNLNDVSLSLEDITIRFKLLWLLNIERGLYNFIEYNKAARLLLIPIQVNLDDTYSTLLFKHNKNNLISNLFLNFTKINPFMQISFVENISQIDNKFKARSCIEHAHVDLFSRGKRLKSDDVINTETPIMFYTRLHETDVVPYNNFTQNHIYIEHLISRKFQIRSFLINDDLKHFWFFLLLIIFTFHIIMQLNFIVKDYFEYKTTIFTKLQVSVFGISLYFSLFMYFLI